MNKDQIEGQWQQVKGKVQEGYGDVKDSLGIDDNDEDVTYRE